MILYKKQGSVIGAKDPLNIDIAAFPSKCIKLRINNVQIKSQETLL